MNTEEWTKGTTEPEERIKFTVATVTYNAGSLLEPTLKSVAEQDYSSVEHLIIDGKSNDRTPYIVSQYERFNGLFGRRHEIRYISEPDEGLYDAMNKALKMASGDYVIFLNAGDRLHSTTQFSELNRMVIKLQLNPGVIYGETDLVDNVGRFLRKRRLETPRTLTWKSFRDGMLVCHQSFYARTTVARQEPYDLRYRFSSDFDWCIRVLKRAEKDGLKPFDSHLILTDYLNDGLTSENHEHSLWERMLIMSRHYGWPTTILRHLWFVVRAVIKR